MAKVTQTPGPGHKALEALATLHDKQVKVGWFETSKYKDGTSVAYVASIQEYGAKAKIKEHTQTIYRQVNSAKTGFLKNGQFVEKSKSNFASDHHVKEYEIIIPPRLGLRQMNIDKRQSWREYAAKMAKAVIAGKSALDMLNAMGGLVAGQIREQIKSVLEPALAKSTIKARARKTASGKITKSLTKPLNDSGYMMATVTHTVSDK